MNVRKRLGNDMRKRKRSFGQALALGIALALLFCFLRQEQKDSVTHSYSADAPIVFLNDEYLAARIRASLKARASKIMLDFPAKGEVFENLDIAIDDLMRFAMSETDQPDEGDYIRFQCGGYALSYRQQRQSGWYSYEAVIEPEYFMTNEQSAEVEQKIDEIMEQMSFDDSTTDIEKVRQIHDYLCQTVTFDMVHKKNSYYHLKSTAYGALIYRQALCQGYSVAAYRLLREAGIPARVVTGAARKVYAGNGNVGEKIISDPAVESNPDAPAEEGYEYHAWNLVCIDGLWYNLDVTWDCFLETDEYFLKGDEEFADHIRDAEYAGEEFYREHPMG